VRELWCARNRLYPATALSSRFIPPGTHTPRKIPLKLHTDSTSAFNTVTAYGDGYVEVNLVRFDHAIAFGPQGAVAAWPVADVAAVGTDLLWQAAGVAQTAADPLAFLDAVQDAAPALPADLATNTPEVLLVGTGARLQFLPRETIAPLLAAGVGVEVMDTQAAARTYNILMAEGRRVVVALIPA